MKKCTKCSKEKSKKDFHKDKSKSDGLRPDCKQCNNKTSLAYRTNNKNKIDRYAKKYREDNKHKISKYHIQYRLANKSKISKYAKQYFYENKEKISRRNAERRKNDLQYKLSCILRERLNKALKNGYKTGSAVKSLGCSIKQLIEYLEDRFVAGMSWKNYGEWHIDHITPLSKFNLIDEKQLKKACHYTNLQPLWATDNLKKGGY